MATTTTTTNKPLNPRAQDLSPKGYNRANIFSGKALDFDGVNDLVTITSGLDAVAGNRMTIAAWIRMDGISGYPSIISNKVNDGDGFAFLVNPTNNELFFQYDGTANQIEAGGKIELNQIYFVTAVYDGTNLKTYINGRNTATSGTATGKVLASTGDKDLFIGRQNTATGFWNGLIAGLRVFNVGLTPAQVSDLYLNPEKIVPDGVASSALKLWLPMMEGAGASAYDGSGNGNDGTINGATWTAGIGAPVAQTALVSWDKGVNLMRYSRGQATGTTTQIWNEEIGYNPFEPLSATGIDGQANAAATYTRNPANGVTSDFAYYRSVPVVNGTAYKVTGYIKLGTATNAVVVVNDSTAWNAFAGANFVATAAAGYSDWKEFSITFTANATAAANIHIGAHQESGVVAQANGTFFIDAFSVRPVTAGDAYIKTNSTAQTSAVLVPEGLTAGASIFGTDIITPRNAFALNLDGASWAQVGDNASLDFGSGEFSLEAWGFWSLNDNQQAIIQKGDAGIGLSRGINLFRTTANTLRVIITANSEVTIQGAAAPISTWKHVVITKDASSIKMYTDGALYGSTSSPAGSVDVSDALRVGTFNNTQYTNGQLANPRIYNRALTAAEVLRNYNADKAKFGL